MEMKANHVFFCIMFILMGLVSHSSGCTYRVEVKTGDRGDAGTDAKVSLKLCTATNCFLDVPDLAQYGTKGPSYDYFERNKLDTFEIPSKVSECFDACSMVISHDNTGDKPGWYLDYVNTGAYNNGVKEYQSNFAVYQWLARDEPPVYDTRAEVYRCPVKDEAFTRFAASLLKQYVNIA